MSGKRSRDKGARKEREIVHKYMDMQGVFAHRVPLSGATANYKGDVVVMAGPHEIRCEVKARASGFKQLYDWLGENGVLHLIADRKEPLTVLPWWLWKCILEKLAKEEYIDATETKIVDG